MSFMTTVPRALGSLFRKLDAGFGKTTGVSQAVLSKLKTKAVVLVAMSYCEIVD